MTVRDKYVSPVKGTRGTYAALARKAGTPAPTYTQAEKLERRRAGYTVTLDGEFVLHEDIAAICGPLAEQVTAAPYSSRFLRTESNERAGHLAGERHPAASIDDVALAVHGVLHAVVGFLSQADAEDKTRHLSGDERARARASIRALAARPALPEFASADAYSGAWATALVELCEPYSSALAVVLGRDRDQAANLSNRLIAELREVDRTAARLQRRLERDATVRAERAARAVETTTEADRARAELAALGIDI